MIPSLALWFDASDPTTIVQSGGAVSQWNDKSSNAYSVIQGTASNRPTYATNLLNGLPGIQLSTTTFLYQVGSSMPNFSSSPATTVYMVAKNGSSLGNGWNIINTMWFTSINGATSRYHFSFGYQAINGITLFTNGVAVANPSSYVVPFNSNAIMGFAASSASNYIFYNGSNTSYASSGAPPSANNGTWFLFGDARVSNPIVTDENIYEFVGFNTVLTTAQQQAVEGYLATKWGLQSSLSNGHPYKTTPLPAAPSLIFPPVYPTSAVSNPEFEPRLIEGCQLWLDGQDLTTLFQNIAGTIPVTASSQVVQLWRDKSSTGNNATSSSSSMTYSQAGVYFPGTQTTGLSLSASQLPNGTADSTWFFVINTTTSSTVVFMGAGSSGAGLRQFYLYAGNLQADKSGTGGISGTVAANTGSNVIFSCIESQSTTTLTGWQNGAQFGTTSFTFNIGTTGATIGSVLGSYIYIGYVGEVLVYGATLSTTQRQQVEAYLAKKWKISALSTQNIYAPGSYLTFVNAPRIPALPMRRAVQTNKFLPSQYSNCVLWLDATDVNGTGTNPATGTITSWTDKSGSGNSSTASGGTPTLTANSLNGKPGVAFSGTSYIQVPRVVTSDWSIFIVFSTTQTGPNCTPTPGPGQAHTDALGNHWWSGQGIFDGEMGGSVNDMGISLCGSPTAYLGYGTGNLAANTDTTEFSATAVNTGAAFIGEFFRTQSSGNLQMFVNGAFQVSTTGGTANRVSPNLKIGAIQTLPAGYYFTGNVYEIVCYTRVLNDIERQQIEGYFAWKWGLKASITSSHPFFLIPPVPLP